VRKLRKKNSYIGTLIVLPIRDREPSARTRSNGKTISRLLTVELPTIARKREPVNWRRTVSQLRNSFDRYKQGSA
jgi:hypothetical protein